MEEENQFTKMLYFEEDEIDKKNTKTKQVFITKRINGKEAHNEKIIPQEEEKEEIFNFDDDEHILESTQNRRENNTRTRHRKKAKRYDEKGRNKKESTRKSKNIENSKEEKREKKKKSKKEKQAEDKKIKAGIIKIVMVILLIIVAIIILLVSPIFDITHIEVVGNNQISAERIVSLSGLKVGDNIFNNIKMRIITNIEEEPFIENVQIERNLPGTIQIKVQERNIDYQLKLINGYIYINKQGYILEKAEKEVNNIILIEGYKTPEETLLNSKRVAQDDLLSLNTIMKLTESAKNLEVKDKITSINIENKDDIVIYSKSENKLIYIGDGSNIQNKMLYIKSILEKEEGKSGKLFINGDLNKGFKPYFREEEV